MTKKEIEKFILGLIKGNNLNGYILEVDLEYPNELHYFHNDYPLAQENRKNNSNMLPKYSSSIANNYGINVGEVNKLIPNLNEWNKLNFNIRTSSFNIFRANLIKIIRPIRNPIFDIFNPLGLKLITRLRLGLTHLNEHRFNHNFNNCITPPCTCSLDTESTLHFFLHCNYYNSARIFLLNDLNSVDRSLLNLSDLSLGNVLLYGGPQFDDSENAFILNSSIK